MICPPDKIFNPATGRCVKRTGKIGKELLKRENKSKETKEVKTKPKNKQKQDCPPDKILNPATGRCVKRTGKIGRELLKQNIKKTKSQQIKECPPDKILNPKTSRCVKRDGKIGRNLIFAKDSRKSSNISVPSYRG